MTRDEAREIAKVVQAYADGKAIQYDCGNGVWRDMQNPSFVDPKEYRIKPEPREWWHVVTQTGSTAVAFRYKADAQSWVNGCRGAFALYTIVHVREVTE